MIRVGILGMGFMGQAHARAYSRIPGVQVTGFYDPLGIVSLPPELGRPIFFTDAESLIRSRLVDVVDICTPPMSHDALAGMACAEGKAVFCEKPLSRGMEAAKALHHKVRQTGVPFMVGQVLRFFPAYAQAREKVLGGALGHVHLAKLVRRVPRPGAKWYYDYRQSGGCLLDTGIHDLDFLRWTFGNPNRISGRHSGPAGLALGTDQARLRLQFSGATWAELEVEWTTDGSWQTSLQIQGSLGCLSNSSERPCLELSLHGAKTEQIALSQEDAYVLELGSFIRALESGAPMPVSLEEGMESLKLALNCLEAGRAVQVGEVA